MYITLQQAKARGDDLLQARVERVEHESWLETDSPTSPAHRRFEAFRKYCAMWGKIDVFRRGCHEAAMSRRRRYS